MYQTVIFDLDGTLLNTLEDLADSTNYALRYMGYKERTIEEVRAFVGNGVQCLIERAMPKQVERNEIESCLSAFKQHYSKNKENKTKPYSGILELLHQLREHHCNLGIVSNKFDRAVKELNKKWFSGYMEVAIGESEGIRKKPSPDTVYQAMKELNAEKVSTLYVGDSEVDIQTARNAGLNCASVTWGFRKKELLCSLNPDYIADNTQELLKIILTNPK